MDIEAQPILFFDGDCGMCSRSVRLLMRSDRSGDLYYAPLQGTTAEALLPVELRRALSTAVYRKGRNNTLFLKSDAILHALIDTDSPWRLCAKVALWLPKFLRDAVYDFIARHRSQLFGKGSCALPLGGKSTRILP